MACNVWRTAMRRLKDGYPLVSIQRWWCQAKAPNQASRQVGD